MARYIDSDVLKKHICHRFMRLNSESKIGLKECKEINAVIDEEKKSRCLTEMTEQSRFLRQKQVCITSCIQTVMENLCNPLILIGCVLIAVGSWVNYTVGLANGIFRTNYLSAQGVVKRLIGRSLKRKKKDGMNLKKSVKGRSGLIKQDTYLIT